MQRLLILRAGHVGGVSMEPQINRKLLSTKMDCTRIEGYAARMDSCRCRPTLEAFDQSTEMSQSENNHSREIMCQNQQKKKCVSSEKLHLHPSARSCIKKSSGQMVSLTRHPHSQQQLRTSAIIRGSSARSAALMVLSIIIS